MSQKPAAVLYAKNVVRVSAFYVEAAALELVHSEEDHVVLESPVFQLVIVAIPERLAASIEVASPPIRRESTPLKLVFPVQSIQVARTKAASLAAKSTRSSASGSFKTAESATVTIQKAMSCSFARMRANPSIEGTSTSGLRPLAAAPHVKR